MSWKRPGDQPPATLRNRLREYPALKQLREEYDRELQTWIDNGWLLLYPDDELGPAKGLISLMVVLQSNKWKVQPTVSSMSMWTYTQLVQMCALRSWANGDSEGRMLFNWTCVRHSCRSTLTSLCGHSKLKIKEQIYCLTRLEFELNVAPQIMRSIVKAVVEQDELDSATFSYIDDTFVNVSLCPAWKRILSGLGWPARTLNHSGTQLVR